METIHKNVIDQVWKETLAAPMDQALDWMDDICDHQPALETYLFSADEHYAPSEERGVIFVLGWFIWKLLLNKNGHPPSALMY